MVCSSIFLGYDIPSSVRLSMQKARLIFYSMVSKSIGVKATRTSFQMLA